MADPSPSDRAAAEAEVLARAGNYAAAAAKFRLAWQADRLRPELFCNIGISLYKAKDLVRAHLLLEQCLEQTALDLHIVEAVHRALRSVEDVLRTSGHAPVRVVVEPSATAVEVVEFAPDINFIGSRVVWLPFGTFHLAARAEGYADATVAVGLTSTESRTVAITLRRREPDPARPPVAVVRPTPSHAAPRGNFKAAAIATTAVSAVAAGVAIYAVVRTHQYADMAGNTSVRADYENDRTGFLRWRTVGIVAGAACAIGAITSGYLWYRVARQDDTRVTLQASDRDLGFAVMGRF